uniref:KIB1-4 beta-propeller domain-containing protein n=1 Tax=Oryza punctata TaxID=4537 RepID=A0A0E0M0T9_ORYPU
MGIKENEDLTSLDSKLAPMLWFHYNYYMPLEESDDNEESGDDDDVSNGDEFSETSDEDEYIEETNDDGRSEDNETDVSDDDDDNTIDEAKEVNDTLLLYSISSKQLVAHSKLDDLKDHFYWITPQGWLLMLHRDSHEIFLWNPFTSQRISLPFDQDRFLVKNYTRCLLSHSPTDPNCIVLVLSLDDTVIWYCHIRGTQWFTHKYHGRRFHRHRLTVIKSMSLLTAVEGQFYTTFGDRIVTLEFLPYPTFDIVPIKSAQNTVYHYADICLLESSGDLFILFFYHPMTCFQKTVEIDVHKLDITRRAWVKVDTLGDRAFIVNITENSGASVNAKEVYLDENCIYFFTCRYKRLYVHNLERGTTTALNPGADINVAAQILMPAF